MTAKGTLHLDGRTLTVDGSAWFDHQWGDFISVGGGGWDWFAVNLDDGTDLTLSARLLNRKGQTMRVLAVQLEAAPSARHQIDLPLSGSGEWRCKHTDDVYVLNGSELVRHPGPRDILKYVPGQRLERMTVS